MNKSRRLIGALLGALAAQATLGTAAAAQGGDSAVILMYHRFGEDDIPATNIRIEQFEAHLATIAAGAYRVLPLPDIVAAFRDGTPLPDRALAITIDDAYLSVYTEAWPRLKAAGLPFTLFVPTDAVDRGRANYMTWEHIRELARAGVGIGNHTASHLHMPTAGRQRNAATIAKANRRFQEELGFVPELFAYPYGEHSLAARQAVIEAGFEAAFGQHSGVAYAAHDSYSLPRFALNESYGDAEAFRLRVEALPLRVGEVTPLDPLLAVNPPPFGFTVEPGLEGLGRLACYAWPQGERARIERLGERRFEVRLAQPFPTGRGRLNCTLPAGEGRWRWYGIQFFIP